MKCRGLQKSLARLAVCMAVLGAASSFAQTYTRGNHPVAVVVSGVSVAGYDGVYHWIGGTAVSQGATMAKYDQTNGTRWVTLYEQNSTSLFVQLHHGDPGVNHVANRVGFLNVHTAPDVWPTNTFGPFSSVGGSATLTMQPPSEYEVAFPDWSSAAVKIPLGFTFGLVLWASVLAFHVPMQWVRSLSQNAS